MLPVTPPAVPPIVQTPPEGQSPAPNAEPKGDEPFDYAAFSSEDMEVEETLTTPPPGENIPDPPLTEAEVKAVKDAEVEALAKAEPVPPVGEPPPTTEPVVVEPSVPPVETPSPQEAQPPSAPPTGEEAQPPPVVAAPPQMTKEQLEQERQDILQQYEQHYSMSEEEGIELAREPDKHLPKLAARIHVEVMAATLGALQAALPDLVGRELAAARSATEARADFFKSWPKLNKQEHFATLRRIGDTYRQQNPGASTEKFVQEVGAMASIVLKVPPDTTGQAPAVTPPAVTPPFTPASPGGGAPPQPKPQLGEFQTMAEEFIEEDRH